MPKANDLEDVAQGFLARHFGKAVLAVFSAGFGFAVGLLF